MSTKWGVDWRKLYRYPSRQWLNLPLAARALGNELIRVAEDDGTIYVGADPLRGVLRAVEAHAREWQWVKVALDALLADRFCTVDGDRLRIRNFVEAQTAVSPSGERMRRHRAETKRGPNRDRAGTKQGPSDPQAGTEVAQPSETTEPPTVTVTVEEKRGDETRSPMAPVPGAAVPSQLALVADGPAAPDPVAAVFAYWQVQLEHPRARLDRDRRRKIEAALASHGAATCRRAIRGVQRSDFHMGRDPRYPGQVHDDITVILRNAKQIEKFAALAEDEDDAPAVPRAAAAAPAAPAPLAPPSVSLASNLRRIRFGAPPLAGSGTDG